MATWMGNYGTASSGTEYSNNTYTYWTRGYIHSGNSSWPDPGGRDRDDSPLEEHKDFIQEQILEPEEHITDKDLEIDF